ncbi:MAG: hypothetical protein ACRCTL_16330 [Pseudomonas sp.]
MHSNTNSQLLCVHAAMAMAVLMGIALLLAGWVPPPSPAMSTLETAQMYAGGGNHIRFAALLMMLGATMFWPFAVVISTQMKRIEGPLVQPLAGVQMACATGTVMAIIIPSALWLVCAFRPERPPEIVQALNDLSWMFFIGAVPPALIQVLAVGLCALYRPSAAAVFPRWYGFFCLWTATGFVGGETVGFFHTGPFAWDGIFAFWMAAVFFFGWILVTWWVVLCAIRNQAAECSGALNR